MKEYPAEGTLVCNEQNTVLTRTREGLARALAEKTVVEAYARRFDAKKRLLVDLGEYTGVIPFCEAAYSPTPLREIAIVSLVGKPVCFTVQCIDEATKTVDLSRREPQKECYEGYISSLRAGDIIRARIKTIRPFGCFVDVGRGIIALLPTGSVSVSRLDTPERLLKESAQIRCIVKSIDTNGAIVLTHRELLGTFEQNADCFEAGETAIGTVRSIEDYGIFVELTPNLTGLAELRDDISVADRVSVYIKSINRENMKIKLVILERLDEAEPQPIKYYIDGGRLSYFRYSPSQCPKIIETFFDI